MIQIFCPMGLSDTEERAFREMYDPGNVININFYRSMAIDPLRPDHLWRYIEQRPELSVYVRVNNSVELLSLPASKRFGAFCYVTNQQDPDRPTLIAVCHAGGTEGIETVWRNPKCVSVDGWHMPDHVEYATIA